MSADRDRPVTLGAKFRAVRHAFRAAGLTTPDLDARLLTAHALDMTPADLVVGEAQALAEDAICRIDGLCNRRLAGEPVARIVGYREFWGLRLRLSPATLEPRPDTETLVETVIGRLQDGGLRSAPLKIADLGTGSGAILLALLSALPNASGIGTDLACDALATARQNARQCGLGERARFAAMSYADALTGPFDVVVCNPPYIATDTLAGLDREVRLFDPKSALDGGADGLDAYRRLAADLPRILACEGLAVVEIGADQADPVTALLRGGGLRPEPPIADLAGRPRVIAIRSWIYPQKISAGQKKPWK